MAQVQSDGLASIEVDTNVKTPEDRGAFSSIKTQERSPSDEGASPSLQQISAILVDLEALEVDDSLTGGKEEKANSPVSIKTEWWLDLDGDSDPLEPPVMVSPASDPWFNPGIQLDFLQELGLMQD